MGKVLKCRQVGPDCDFEVHAKTEDEILQVAGKHAKEAHGIEVTPQLVEKVRALIHNE